MLKRNLFSTVIAITALTSAGATRAACQPCVDTMDEKIKKMTQEIDKLFADDQIISTKASTKKPLAPTKNKLSINQEGPAVVITLILDKGIKSMDASIQDGLMSIEIPDNHQKIYVRYNAEHNYLSVAQGSAAQKTSEKEGIHQEMASFSSVQHGQTLAYPIKFNEAQVEYQDDTLTITIPQEIPAPKTAQKIKVHIK